ncbi:MAG: hypothetical protein Q4C55_07240 [Eubacterium sp.]|nr:hypothetical protein [Eubacterium sp.]
MFKLPEYTAPDFDQAPFITAPEVKTASAPEDGVVPENFYATSIYPEYFKIQGQWVLARESRMDCVVVIKGATPCVLEFRNVKAGDAVVVGRTDDGSQGIFSHAQAFKTTSGTNDTFAFRTSYSRESAFSGDYDRLYEVLRHDRECGTIIWVLGPAVAFDHDSRKAMASLIKNGYADAVFAGNALATHDLESHFFHTALGQDIYSKCNCPGGHYHHIETINRARACGSLKNLVKKYCIRDGIVAACVAKDVPLVLAGSIRDDGPLPGVISDVYAAQDIMRSYTRRATTVICLATQLHTIATGNMTPSYQVTAAGIRPVYFYCADISEFVANKLRDRGSLSSESFITNIQDFVVNVERHLVSHR